MNDLIKIQLVKATYTYILIISSLCISCESLFNLEGNMVTNTYELSKADRIIVEGVYNVVFSHDSLNVIEVLAGSKVVEDIKFNYDSSSLTINDHIVFGNFKNITKPTIIIHFTTINTIKIDAACNVSTLVPINLPSLNMSATGDVAYFDMEFAGGSFGIYNNRQTNGKYTFRGEVHSCVTSAYASAIYNLEELDAESKIVENNSINDIKAGTCAHLKVGIYNRGNIYYSGIPQIDTVALESSGKLIKVE